MSDALPCRLRRLANEARVALDEPRSSPELARHASWCEPTSVLAGRAISMPFRTRHHRFVTVNHGHSRSSDLRRPYYDLRPTASRTRRPALLAAELAVSSYGEVAARAAAAGEPRWLIQGLWAADAYGVLAAKEKAGKTGAAPGAGSELADMQAELEAHPAALVVLDPLYLAAAGASGANLTTWALSSKPSKVSASTPAAPCWW